MTLWLPLSLLLLSALVSAGGLTPGITYFLPFSSSSFLGVSGIQGGVYSINDWFTLAYESSQSTLFPAGGFAANQDVKTIHGGNSYIATGSSNMPLLSLDVLGTCRFDSSGWAVLLWEITNDSGNTVTVSFTNFAFDYFFDPESLTLLGTSTGDTNVDASDSWVAFNSNGVLTGISFGEYLSNLYFYEGVLDTGIGWAYSLNLDPGDTKSFLAVLGFGDPASETALSFLTRTNNVLADGNALLTYETPSGYNLLDHLSQAQLARVVNWNVQAGGVGGDPHGRHFDGSHFEFPHIDASYCLYHDDEFQVNILVQDAFVREVVVFAKLHRWTIHARIGAEQPEYWLNNQLVDVPAMLFEGKIRTEISSSKHSDVLGELSRYHVNSLVMPNHVTIIGGLHPQTGGFFNVQVRQRSIEVHFPSILQLHGHPEIRGAEDEISASILPDLWFAA